MAHCFYEVINSTLILVADIKAAHVVFLIIAFADLCANIFQLHNIGVPIIMSVPSYISSMREKHSAFRFPELFNPFMIST